MAGIGEQFALLCGFDNAAEIHYRDAVTDMGHHSEIMCDEQIGKIMLALEVDQQIDHLGLDRHIERRYRLIADDQPRPQRQSPRDADALALAAGELVRIVLHLIRPEPDLLEQFGDAVALFASCRQTVDAEWLADDIARRHPGIERSKRVLEHDLHRTSMRAQVCLAEIGDIQPIKANAAPRRLDEAQDAARHRRFAAAGLADKAEGFADANREADAVHGMHGAHLATEDAASHRIVLDEVRYIEQGARLGHGTTSSAARQHAAR